jgi:hypothetical protein
MSAVNAEVKQYPVILVAGQLAAVVTPANANRTLLEIQVTGATAASFRWVNSVQGDGGDFMLAVGETRIFKDPCPTARLSVSATAPTTLAVVEGTTVNRGNGGSVR